MVLPTPEQENHDDRRNDDFMQRLNAALIKNEMLDEVKELTPQGLKKTFGRKKNRYVRSDGSQSKIPFLQDTGPNVGNSLGNGMRMGMEMAGGPVVGLGIGYGLDQWLNTSPLCLIIFLIFGLGAGFLNVYRMIKQEDPWVEAHNQAQQTLTKSSKTSKSATNN